MIEIKYVVSYWGGTTGVSTFRCSAEYDATEHNLFTEHCFRLKRDNKFISCAIQYNYLTDDWWRIQKEDLMIAHDRQRILQENSA